MKHTHDMKTILLILIACCPILETWAQTTKEITVSQGNPYTDHISLKDDSKDMDLMAKFIFNEPTNTLSIYLISYRDLFVFQTDTPYKQAIKGRNIKPDKLPFVVNTDPGVKYQLTKEYQQSISKSKKKYVFKKWIEYSGLAPIPTEYKMVNDYIKQDFTIMNKADAVTITLHDVMMMDQETTSNANNKKYNIVWGKNLDINYHIYIKRNPCFGMEEEIAAAAKTLESIVSGYKNLVNRFGSGIVSNKESLENFKEMKQLLLGQYPAKTEKNACPDIQEKWDAYNQYVDSISNMKCRIRSAMSAGGSNGGKGGNARTSFGERVNVGFILTQARQIDSAVSRWLVSKDKTERSDLRKQCQEIIKVVKASVAGKRISTASQQNAIKIFNQAVRYYHTTCK